MGWIKVDRKLLEHDLWKDKPFSKGQAWLDLLLLANYKDSTVKYQGKVITCKRGTVYRSISSLARRWGWSRKKTTAFIRTLEGTGMVTAKVTTQGTTLTIENYGKFQGKGTTKGTTKGTAKDTTKGTRKEEVKEIKENKEGRPSDSPDEEGNPWPDDIWET